MLNPVLQVRLPVVAAASMGLFLLSCDREPPAPAPAEAPAAVAPPATPTPTTPALSPALDRAGLLAAAARAASAYAAGDPATATPDPLVRRAFDISLAFGCAGAAPAPAEGVGDGLARWSWGPDRQTIRLALTPGDWTGSALI